jgi:hypothetical protein
MTEYFTKDGNEFKPVDQNLLTQTDVDSVIEKRLERERSKFADYDTLKEKAGKVDTITQEFTTKLKEKDTSLEDLTKQLNGAKLETDKVKIIGEFKLSDDLAEFVTGETVDEMRTRAEKLSKGIAPGKVTVTKTGKPSGDETKSDTKKVVEGLFGKKPD